MCNKTGNQGASLGTGFEIKIIETYLIDLESGCELSPIRSDFIRLPFSTCVEFGSLWTLTSSIQSGVAILL